MFIGLEVNAEKTKYMTMSLHQNLIIGNLLIENVEKLKYLGVTLELFLEVGL